MFFRFVDNLNFINDDRELETNYSNIYHEELELGRESMTHMKQVF